MNFEKAAGDLTKDAAKLKLYVESMSATGQARDDLLFLAGRLDGMAKMLAGLKDAKPGMERQ
jgi:hypothetical protein